MMLVEGVARLSLLKDSSHTCPLRMAVRVLPLACLRYSESRGVVGVPELMVALSLRRRSVGHPDLVPVQGVGGSPPTEGPEVVWVQGGTEYRRPSQRDLGTPSWPSFMPWELACSHSVLSGVAIAEVCRGTPEPPQSQGILIQT